MKRESGETVVPAFSKLVGDLRYSARFKGTGEELDVFVFVEHQSRTDRFMSFRMLEYVCAAYRQQLPSLRKDMRFPYPLAVMLYHGNKPWKEIPPMRDLIAIPQGMAADILKFPMHLIDLAVMPVERLCGHPMVCALLDSLQSASVGVLPIRLQAITARLRGLGKEKRIKSWTEALARYYYTLAQGEVMDAANELECAFMSLYGKREAEEMVMTVAEKLHKEGRAEGVAEGMAKGQIKTLITFLEARFGAVPAALHKKLLNVRDDGCIETMSKLAATCQNLKEFQKAL